MQPQSDDISRRGLLALLLFSFVVWFGTLDYRKLVKPDEGRYAEISREMVVTGDWLTPRLNGIKYFEKPPLQYWTTAAVFKVFGLHEWAARLWTGLTGYLTVLTVWWAGRRFYGPSVGLYAGLVLGSGFYFVAMGQINTLDMGLTFFTTLALVGFCSAQRDGADDRERRWGMLVTWAAMAFAVLSKGLIGIVLPGAALALYTLFTRDWTILRRLQLVPGVLIFLAIAAPWFIAVSVKNPEFPWFFFIREHLLRYATPEARREGPVYYFVGVLLVGIVPWVIVMGETLWVAVRRRRTSYLDKPALILLIWTIFVFVFFSLSSSKLPAYILPIFPALALLMGKRLAELEARRLIARILPVALIALSGSLFVARAVDRADDPVSRTLYQQYSYWVYAALTILLLGAVYCCWRSWRGRKLAALLGLGIAGLLSAQVAVMGYETLAPAKSAYHLAEKIRPYVKEGVSFYSVKTYDQTLPFYLNRTLTLVRYFDEFSYGLEQEPNLAIGNIDDFLPRWEAEREALAVMQPETYAELRAKGYAMEVITNDSQRVVVKKPGEAK